MIEDRHNMGGLESMDSMDMPLTPASFAGLDHKVVLWEYRFAHNEANHLNEQELEERPLTSMTMRREKATVYDEPPEKWVGQNYRP